MGYRYHSRRSARRLARKSKKNFFLTIIIVGALIYATLKWILPNFIGGIGTIKSTLAPDQQVVKTSKNVLAPPVLNIPFEATNSAVIDIKGFGVPKSKVRIFIDDEKIAEVTVKEDGTFAAESIELSLGINNIFGKTIDEQGSESLASKTIRLSYLAEKPKLELREPEDNRSITGGDRKVTVSGSTSAGVRIYINGGQTIVDRDGNFSSVLEVSEGENTITVKAADGAGNSTEIQRRVVYSP